MKTIWAAACVLGVVAVGGCVADLEEPSEAPALEEQALPLFEFSPSVFKFVITVPDDGQGLGGGEQTARAVLHFPAVRPGMTCNVKVTVAIRSSIEGKISPQRAAEVTARIATVSASVTYHLHKDAPTAMFCNEWRGGMQAIFSEQHGGFGARVAPW